MTVSPRFDALIRITSRLVELIDREVEILHARRPADIGPLQEEKAALVAAYEEEFEAVKTNPRDIAALEPALKAELVAVVERLNRAVAENARALDASREANDRLLKAIVDAVSESRAHAGPYSAKGTRFVGGPAKAKTPMSLTLDTTL